MEIAPSSKAEFRQRYARGEFGNRPISWNATGELAASGYSGLVTARKVDPGPLAGGVCRYRMPVNEACDLGADWYFNESMPDDLLLIQGEVFRSADASGLRLDYSTEPGISMRDAMKHPKSAERTAAKLIMQSFLWPDSYDDVIQLLDQYDAIVEFGAYSIAVGNCLLRNAVIWEVRNY